MLDNADFKETWDSLEERPRVEFIPKTEKQVASPQSSDQQIYLIGILGMLVLIVGILLWPKLASETKEQRLQRELKEVHREMVNSLFK